MNLTDIQVPILYVGSMIVFAVRLTGSFNRLEQFVNLKTGELEQANKLQDENRKAREEMIEYKLHGLQEVIEHRTKRLSGSIGQIQQYLEKKGDFVRRDPLYGTEDR